MSTHPWIDRICIFALVLALLLALAFCNGEALGLQQAGRVLGYETRLFDGSRVHTVDLLMEDWEDFIAGCEDENYVACTAVIDGEVYRNIAIHAVRLKKSKTKRKKKIAAAIYEYQADCDGEWGGISVDFENGMAEVVRLADWGTVKTNRYANKAIAYLLSCENEKMPKETMIAFEP